MRVEMFDNIGTLIGVTKRAGFLRADGTLPNAGRALLAITLGESKKMTTLGCVVAGVFFLEFFHIWPFS